jgi:hypothetical protein
MDFQATEQSLEAVGPYRDPDVEGLRQKIIKALEHDLGEFEQLELKKFALPQAVDATLAIRRTFNGKALPMLKLPPVARDKMISTDLAATLDEERTHALEAAGILKEVSPFRKKEYEQARLAGVEFLESAAELFGRAAQVLREERPWKDVAEAGSLEKRFRELGERWDKVR